jgi:hypothetical protein
MQPRDLAAYGGPYANARPVSDPLTQVAAEKLNLTMEDVAQLTRVPMARVVAMFVTDGANNPTNVVYGKTMWGTGTSFKPTVTHTATGVWTVTWSATYADGLGEDETLGLADAEAKQEALTSGFTPRLVYGRAHTGNTARVYVYSLAAALTDTTGDRITVWGW